MTFIFFIQIASVFIAYFVGRWVGSKNQAEKDAAAIDRVVAKYRPMIDPSWTATKGYSHANAILEALKKQDEEARKDGKHA